MKNTIFFYSIQKLNLFKESNGINVRKKWFVKYFDP